MANHKTKISGTVYSIKSGKTKVGGTVYGIKKGKTKVGGTVYDINFGSAMCEVTFHYAGCDTYGSAKYVNLKIGSNYYYGDSIYTETIMLPIGTNLEFYFFRAGDIYLEINGASTEVYADDTTPYVFSLTTAYCDIAMASGTAMFYPITITTSD